MKPQPGPVETLLASDKVLSRVVNFQSGYLFKGSRAGEWLQLQRLLREMCVDFIRMSPDALTKVYLGNSFAFYKGPHPRAHDIIAARIKNIDATLDKRSCGTAGSLLEQTNNAITQ